MESTLWDDLAPLSCGAFFWQGVAREPSSGPSPFTGARPKSCSGDGLVRSAASEARRFAGRSCGAGP